MLHYHEFVLESNSLLALGLAHLHIVKFLLYFIQALVKHLLSNASQLKMLQSGKGAIEKAKLHKN